MDTTPSKMVTFGEQSGVMDKVKRPVAKLWASKGRLFNERIIYLNKSTSKHIIYGLDPDTFKVVMLLCDRASGYYIPFLCEQVYAFMTHVQEVLSGTISNDKFECNVTFSPLNKDIWIISTSNRQHWVTMHRISLENFIRAKNIILREMFYLDGDAYGRAFDEIFRRTEGFTEGEILSYLQDEVLPYTNSCLISCVMETILCH